MATNIRKVILIRAGIIFFMMCVMAGFIIAALLRIQFEEKVKWKSMADSIGTKVFDVEPIRGNIFDCNDNLLATSLPIYDIRIDGKSFGFKTDTIFYKNVDSLAWLLSSELRDKSKDEYKQLLKDVKKKGNRYFLLKRQVSYPQMKRLGSFPIFRLGKFNGGFLVSERNRREKPFDNLAERTIGFSKKNVARVGLEGSFEDYLTGTSGKRVMQRIAGGTWVPIDNANEIDALHGKDLYTTLDINLQDVAEHALMQTLSENEADYGTTILMEVETGYIKAIANLKKNADGSYSEAYNFAIGEVTEPGSTFKLVSVMALLEDAGVDPTEVIDGESGIKYFCSNAKMEDSKDGGYGKINLIQAFEYSSNVIISKLVDGKFKKDVNTYWNRIEKLGLTKPLGLQIKGEGIPSIKHPSDKAWSCTSLPWMSIGYEILLTPMQITTLYNAVANNGKMLKPIFVSHISQAGQIVKEYKPEVMVEKICSDKTLKTLREMMEGVVRNGTASKLRSDYYKYAGKTGTAKIANAGKGYSEHNYRASFCGYFPADKPKYTCFVMISHPTKGKIYGAEVALPVFKEIADKVYASSFNLHQELKYSKYDFSTDLPIVKNAFSSDIKRVLNGLGISFHNQIDSVETNPTDWVGTKINDRSLTLKNIETTSRLMPNVNGMSIKDAINLLEGFGLKVNFSGAGKVKKQSLSPGSGIRKGLYINLELG